MKYTVIVDSDGTFWYKQNTRILHRENGPAVESFDGTKLWYLENKRYTEEEFFNNKYELTSKKETYEGKVVEIEGIKYTLQKV